MITNRNMADSPCSLSRETEKAVTGVAKARPVSNGGGHGEDGRPRLHRAEERP